MPPSGHHEVRKHLNKLRTPESRTCSGYFQTRDAEPPSRREHRILWVGTILASLRLCVFALKICDFWNVLVFVLFDQYSQHFHERCQGMGFIFTNLVNQTIQQSDRLLVFFLSLEECTTCHRQSNGLEFGNTQDPCLCRLHN